MNPRLLALIEAYKAATAAGLAEFLSRAKLRHPFEWREAGLPRQGDLPGSPTLSYAFHGIGLEVTCGDEHIDFDFGFDGRTDGFNDWWLGRFASEHFDEFAEFTDGDHLRTQLALAREAGAIGRPYVSHQDTLDYVLDHRGLRSA